MERIGEEVAANDLTLKAELKRKDRNLSLKPEGNNILESPIICASSNTDWPESPLHNYTNTIEANHFRRRVASLVGSEPPCTSPSMNMNENGAITDEHTVGNYRTQNSALVFSPNSYNQVQWQHLHQIASGSGYKASHGGSTSQDMDQLMLRAREQFMKMNSNVHGPNFRSRKQMDKVHDEISPYTRARDNNLSVVSGQLKTLNTSGFSQLFGKKTLKGKAVVGRIPETRRELGSPAAGQIDEKQGLVSKVVTNSLLKSSADNRLLSCVNSVSPSFHNGMSLRDWLKPGCSKREKVESMRLFRQIVELVDSAHSQGIALQELRPSNFYLFPPGRVIYTGSITKKESESAMKLDDNKKRQLEQDMQATCASGSKQQKLNDEMKSRSHRPQFTSGGSSNINRLNGTHFEVHTQNRSSYRSTPIATERQCYISPEELNVSSCSLSSNIYSLGVLLFELLCYFESSEVHSAVMLNLRHRILPPSFLSENQMETGFCLWLLHPEPSSRPTTREILQSELTSESQELHSRDELPIFAAGDEVESELLLDFLVSMKDQKETHASKLVKDIKCLEEDIKEIFSQGKGCLNYRKLDLPFECPTTAFALDQSFPVSKINETRLMKNISQLEEAYFSMRSQIQVTETDAAGSSDVHLPKNSRDKWSKVQNEKEESNMNPKSFNRLGTFFDGLCKFTRYSQFEACGTLRNGDLLNSPNVICSLSFDRDEEYIAAAGVSKKIKIFEFNSLLDDSIDIHYPVVEMTNKSKLSCVCWNKYIKNYLASTDYDGVVQMWDASTGQGFSQFTEHKKRAWSVDFSQADPTKFASGSDDCSVKLWSINEKSSIAAILNSGNICCVQFSEFNSHLLAFGSADYKVYCYDLRNTRIPWCTLACHDKTVSYAKFLDSETLVSASTDNTLKLWDLTKSSSNGPSSSACSITYKGHTNEKNFVGLSVLDGYIACGSETNEVYSYYRSLPMPIASYKFGSTDPISGHEIGDDYGQFVSSVCWRQKSKMVVVANSSGCIKLLRMV
ncbi:hypothetical protein Ddye_017606 [Dipteronia dyeriana]|uniref:Protein kinase domain-containing protein n=1 Tax=Dipteronia dyeriana TaxID=168575 RepID=A0AAD9X1B4_9ROSI|nr:hypothetical protein Ddye_017606 [Dipteronia dyeriana]